MAFEITGTTIDINAVQTRPLVVSGHSGNHNVVKSKSGILYAAIWDSISDHNLYRSTDNGYSWETLANLYSRSDLEGLPNNTILYSFNIRHYIINSTANGPQSNILVSEKYNKVIVVQSVIFRETTPAPLSFTGIRLCIYDTKTGALSKKVIGYNLAGYYFGMISACSNENSLFILAPHAYEDIDDYHMDMIVVNISSSLSYGSVRDTTINWEESYDCCCDDAGTVYIACLDNKYQPPGFDAYSAPECSTINFQTYNLDGGWGTQLVVDTLANIRGSARDLAIALDGYGNLCMTWCELDNKHDPTTSELKYALSKDKGLTWTVTDLADEPGFVPYKDPIVFGHDFIENKVVPDVTTQHRTSVSSDGSTWTETNNNDNTPGTWQNVCWAPSLGIYCAVANSGTYRVMTSPDGITWTGRTAAEANTWNDICWSEDLTLFVAVAEDGTNRVMTSPDGITWTARAASLDKLWHSVTYAPSLTLFCAVSFSATNTHMTSPDGITWTSQAGSNSEECMDICWSEHLTLFVVLDYTSLDTTAIQTSPDGINWTDRSCVGITQWPAAVTWNDTDDKFLMVDNNGWCWGSSNGTTWSVDTTLGFLNNPRALVWATSLGKYITRDYWDVIWTCSGATDDDYFVEVNDFTTNAVIETTRGMAWNPDDEECVIVSESGSDTTTITYSGEIAGDYNPYTSFSDVLGGNDGGFIISYTQDTSGEVGGDHTTSLVRTLDTDDGETYILGGQKLVVDTTDDITGARFFDAEGSSLLDIDEPGLVRMAWQVGQGTIYNGSTTVPIDIDQGLLSSFAYPEAINDGSWIVETAATGELLVDFEIMDSITENVDYYDKGMIGVHTTKYIDAFNTQGTITNIYKYEPKANSQTSDESGYNPAVKYLSRFFIDPLSYTSPNIVQNSNETVTYVEQDIRKIYIPPTFHLSRDFILNEGNFLKRTVWILEFGGNEYELTQVVPRFLDGQILYYECNAYVVGPSRDPFRRAVLPSET